MDVSGDTKHAVTDILQCGHDAILQEIAGLEQLANTLGTPFEQAVNSICASAGRVVVTGIGKSGHIGKKIAATFSSTGTPSLFVHPAEASHGDLGMVGRSDVVLAISKSGESPELADIVSYCNRHAMCLIAITAKMDGTLGRASTITLLLPDVPEACPLGLAPTTSTTMTLALGDALAIACLQKRQFRASDFREFHPGGKLGLRLKRVSDIMCTGDMVPIVQESQSVGDAILEMTKTSMGCAGVIDANGVLSGVFTDGDLRRCFSAASISLPIRTVMTKNPFRTGPDALVEEVAHLFTTRRVPSVFVVDQEDRPIGIVHIHTLLRSGLL